MTVHVPEPFQSRELPFGLGLLRSDFYASSGAEPSSLATDCLRQQEELVTTAQFFALWRAVGEVSG